MRIAILFVLCVALTGCTVQFNPGAGTQTPARGGTDAEQAAVRVAASAVLALLDAEQWDKVWSGAGTSLAQTSSQSDFATGVRTAHTLFGAPKSRAITGYAFPESLEGAPPGQYGIVFYATDFSKFDGVEEQVVLVHERGEWRLAGYWAEKHKKLKLL